MPVEIALVSFIWANQKWCLFLLCWNRTHCKQMVTGLHHWFTGKIWWREQNFHTQGVDWLAINLDLCGKMVNMLLAVVCSHVVAALPFFRLRHHNAYNAQSDKYWWLYKKAGINHIFAALLQKLSFPELLVYFSFDCNVCFFPMLLCRLWKNWS